MSARANDLAARAKAARASRAPKPAVERPVHAHATRTKPVRVSLDLEPQAHRQLLEFSQEISEQAGRARVPHAQVLRALVDELQRDPALRMRISDAVIAALDI